MFWSYGYRRLQQTDVRFGNICLLWASVPVLSAGTERLQSFSEFFYDVHKFRYAGNIHRMFKDAVVFKSSCTYGAVGICELSDNIVLVAAGVAQNRRMSDGSPDTGEDLRIGLASGCESGYADGIRPVVKLRGAGDLLDGAVCKVSGSLRNDVLEEPDVFAADGHLVTDGLSYIGVPQAEIRCIDTADDLTDECSAYRDAQVQRRDGIPEAVDAVGYGDF